MNDAEPREVVIDLSRLTFDEVLDLMAGRVEMSQLPDQIRRAVVGGTEGLTGAQAVDAARQFIESITLAANPKGKMASR